MTRHRCVCNRYTIRVSSSELETSCVPSAETEVEIVKTAQADLAVVSPPAGTELNGCLTTHTVKWKKPAGMEKTSVREEVAVLFQCVEVSRILAYARWCF